MNVLGSQALLVTPERWEEPDMRDALSTRDVSAVYQLLRKQGISLRQIAASTGQSQSEVSEILKGRQVMAYGVLARIADRLSIPRGYMGLAYDEGTEVRVLLESDDPGYDEDELVKRRRFLAHAAAVTVGAALMGTDSESWTSQPARAAASDDDVEVTDVPQVEETRAMPSRTPLRLVGGAACLLPPTHQARYREEWHEELSHLAATATRWRQFTYSVRLLCHAVDMRRALIGTAPDSIYEVETW